MSKIGEILRTGRERKKLSQDELAKRIGIDRSVISKIETGSITQPSYAIVKQWSRVCECEDLVGQDLTGKDAFLILGQLESKMNKIKELVSFFKIRPERR